MLDAKRADEWDHTAALLTMITNAFRSKHHKPSQLEDFNPYRQTPAVKKQPFGHLKALLDGNGSSNKSR